MIRHEIEGQIIAIGNAPTALLTLLNVAERDKHVPALIVGMPVGFVNASQAKELLATSPYNFFTLHGRRGGSALTAACLNALIEIAAREEGKL